MSINKLMTGAALILTGLSTSAMAATDGKVNFEGNVVDTPCVVASKSVNQTVTLNNVKSSSFTAVGNTSAPVGFTISLEQCTPGTIKTATAAFSGLADAKDNTLVSVGTASGSATGIGIEILDAAKGTTVAMNGAGTDFGLINGNTDLNFQARYKSTNATVGVGPANGSADFAITYK